ncbi:MAG: glycosyltransferase family 4 protein [Candidatus Jorgensenbacteria bacterium]
MRLLIISDSYPPEVRSAAQLMQELAEGLRARGHDVTVATTVPAYNLVDGTNVKDVPREETVNGVRVVRIATLPHHRVNYIFRGVNQLFLPHIFARAVRKILSGPFDKIIVHSPPLPLALAAAKLAKHYRARFIANIHDIFPQNGIDLVVAWQKPLIQLFFGPMERHVYRSADMIVVPSENHARYLETKRGMPAQKLRVIPHWINTAPFDSSASLTTGAAPVGNRFRKMWGLEDTFIFFFGGVLGPSQGLELVLDAAETFRANSEVKFLFVGDGTARQSLERTAREIKLTNVIFKPFVSSGEYHALVKEMDVGIATLTSKNTTPAVPAKLMGYMAGGIPVVVAVHRESDAIRIVKEAKCGFAVTSDNREAVIAAFRAAYEAGRASLKTLGENGYRYVKEYLSVERAVKEMEQILVS